MRVGGTAVRHRRVGRRAHQHLGRADRRRPLLLLGARRAIGLTDALQTGGDRRHVDERQSGLPGRPLVGRGGLGERLVRGVDGGVDGSGTLGQRQDMRGGGQRRERRAAVGRPKQRGRARQRPGHEQRPGGGACERHQRAAVERKRDGDRRAPVGGERQRVAGRAQPAQPHPVAVDRIDRHDPDLSTAERGRQIGELPGRAAVARPGQRRRRGGSSGEREIDRHRVGGGDLETGDEVAGRARVERPPERRAAVGRFEHRVDGARRAGGEAGGQHPRAVARIDERVLAELGAERAASDLPPAGVVVGEDQLAVRDGVEPVRRRRPHLIEAPVAVHRLLAGPDPGGAGVLRPQHAKVGGKQDLVRTIGRHEDALAVGKGAIRARRAGQQGEQRPQRPTCPRCPLTPRHRRDHRLKVAPDPRGEGSAGDQTDGAAGSSTTTSTSPAASRAWQERRSLLMK